MKNIINYIIEKWERKIQKIIKKIKILKNV